MRVKVLWKEHKFILPTGKNNVKVSDLFRDIASKFASYSLEEFIVSELKTIDGFIISPHYLIEEAIVDNETLVVVDFESWKNEQFKLCNKSFVLFALENFEQDNKLRVNIGLNTLNKLFVSIGLYNKLYRLELFDSSDLRAFHKDGDHVVTHWEDGKGNVAKVFFVVEGGVVKTVRAEISTESAPIPQIQSINILVSGNKIEAGEIKTIQNAYAPYTEDSTVTPQDEVRTGKSYQDYDIDYYVTDGGNGTDASNHAVVTGPSNIRFEQTDITRAEMSQYSNNGVFWNSFYTDFQITNNDPDRITLSKISAEYQDIAGEWKPMSALFGTKRSNSNYDYNWRTDSSNIIIPLDPRDTIKLSFNTRVEIKGDNSERRYRSHHSLPNVLNIKVHVTDDKQKVTTIPLLYKNKTEDPVFPILKTRQARVDKPIVFFQTVDNLKTTNRGWVQLTKSTNDNKNILVYSSNFSSSQHYISEVSLHEAVYQASKNKESKYKISHYSASNSDFSVEVFAHIDFEKKRVTSLVFELFDSTKTNSSVKYFPIPKFVDEKW
ncbi:hypothetical protein DICPUDRAFT_78921 [Dictyostelium purpureum]|uniref:Par3/HAL N-terminal domain-containing protein n=1 Tax=Dictyostelium purpureum TaxID=5786 RepID=F0ZL03_DICPU|nr:uncharacterized protein DICPUDRAFT_78921 [Dictyostelium purpureum]EGC35354.1 hypothetical protein DICPUDRAFT_78921 [Dictyostelium purpureum]|eukprot:XP_003288092.1 hypothetical protein DICPUDRAFT_78921 [Dictyostelium purpureum]